MSGNVVSIAGNVVPGAVNDALVERLEEHLARAKRGEIVSGAFAFTTANNRIATGWDAEVGDSFRMAAAVAVLNQRVMTALGEAGE